ncbi:MAG: type IV pilus assembly protein PilM [Patescibacteria group bacterium]|nr:type IV pilus assembly protein PilM [Patescibacteria group bacterium]
MSFLDTLLGKKKEASVLGVDIGSSSLKVVQLRKEHGKAVLETYGELALGPYAGAVAGAATALSAEEIAASLADLLREAKVTTKSAGVSIPFARSLLVLVELPYRDDPKEQKTIIELEARKYIPVPVSEVQLDWFVVPPPAEGPGAKPSGKPEKMEVFLIAVHNDELALLQRSVAAAGLTSSFFEIEIFSTIRAVVDEPVKPVLVLDIGAATTKTYIVERGVVALSHSIAMGSHDITRAIAVSENIPLARAEALKKQEGLAAADGPAGAEHSPELVFSRIFAGARRVLMQFEQSRKEAVTKVVLTGGGGVTRELGTYAKNLFSIDVVVADPFKKCEAPVFMRPILEEIGPEFAVAVGLALRKLAEL